MPTVSVIIPAYNHGAYLGEAIEGVLAQTLAPREVIVVDDGSTDETPAVIGRFGDRLRSIRQPNRGVAAARNAGAALASGDFLAFLDADDVWAPSKLSLQVERFRADPSLGLVHGGVEDIDPAGQSLGRHLDGLEGWVADELLRFRRPVILGGGSGVAIPAAVFRQVGGFDPQLSTSADWDLYYRIACRWRVGFVPEPLLRYRRHGANMHGDVRRMARDMLLAYTKAFSSPPARSRWMRRRCYGNLHATLAGSFFAAGNYGAFARHAARSLVLTPGNAPRFLGYPVRRWRRRGRPA